MDLILSRTMSNLPSAVDELVVISDTTELNYSSKKGRIKDQQELGPIGNPKNLGYFMHPSLVFDLSSHEVIGLGGAHLWHREASLKDTQSRDLKDFKEKESSRWLEEAEKVHKRFESKANRLCYTFDREGDIYNVIHGIVYGLNQRFVIRSQHNRSIVDEQYSFLQESLNECDFELIVTKKIKGNRKRKSREAKLQVRYKQIALKRPKRKATQGLNPQIEVWVIEVLEEASSVPSGEAPINWVLLTNNPINTEEDLIKCIEIYRSRWLIEELFRILKSKGLALEDASLESGKRLKRLGYFALETAVQILRLREAGKHNNGLMADTMYAEKEVELLKKINRKVEGNTQKQKNPFAFLTLAWVYWIIGRLGGWDGYINSSTPGVITLVKGIKKFHTIIEFSDLTNSS